MLTTDYHKIPLEAFEEVPPELKTEAFFRAHELVSAYVGLRAREVVESLPPGTAVAPGREHPWDWLLRRARACAVSTAGSAELRGAILAEEAALEPALDLIDAAAEGYPAFLKGERDGGSVIFDPRRPHLWERYFSNANPLYAAGNLLAAHAAGIAFEGRGDGGPLRVLEVGAGLGSAAEALLETLGDRIGEYLLTDISPGFLRQARDRLEGRAAGGARLAFRLLDLNRAPASWAAGPGAWDLVHAVNVLHAVRDLGAALRGLRERLAPGGALVLGECVRPRRGEPVHPEMVFLLLDELREAVLDPETRPEPGFLDAASWRASLERAGFSRVRFVPPFERAVAAYPAHCLAAIIARS
ncbi:MAG: class I SAM-dependent methyltransferase [Planctomycetes bacterium]|nr:class I SAM-dependent methyltransferase [Planctomycetota bacterium]